MQLQSLQRVHIRIQEVALHPHLGLRNIHAVRLEAPWIAQHAVVTEVVHCRICHCRRKSNLSWSASHGLSGSATAASQTLPQSLVVVLPLPRETSTQDDGWLAATAVEAGVEQLQLMPQTTTVPVARLAQEKAAMTTVPE